MELPAGFGPASSVRRTEILPLNEESICVSPIPVQAGPGKRFYKARFFAGCGRLYAGVEPAPKYWNVLCMMVCCACLFAWQPLRESNPHFQVESLMSWSFRRRDLVCRAGIEPAGPVSQTGMSANCITCTYGGLDGTRTHSARSDSPAFCH